MSKLKMVSCDLDSTICSTKHRWHMIKRDGPEPMDWEQYSLACVNDTPGPAFAMAKYLTETDSPWIVVSGRSEIARKETREWLHSRGLYPWAIFLCDDRHLELDHGQWKALRLQEIQENFDLDIVLHVDDIAAVAVETEKIGIPTMLVHPVDSNIIDHLG